MAAGSPAWTPGQTPDTVRLAAGEFSTAALGEALASSYGAAASDNAGLPSGEILPHPGLLDDLRLYEAQLDAAYNTFRTATTEALTLSYAAEWLLDNNYIVRQALRQVREDLPRGYLSRLPRVTGGPAAGLPRVYAVSRAVLAHQRLKLDTAGLIEILEAFQQQAPLNMGELWAVPIFLRYALIEWLLAALDAVIVRAGGRAEPAALPVRVSQLLLIADAQPEEALPGQAVPFPPLWINTQDAVANAILSLRAISELDWKDFFESASLVERLLRQEPAGVYPRMDFATRDRYRKAVEGLAADSRRSEMEVARAALDLAGAHGAASGGWQNAPREAHVGWLLVSGGRPVLEKRLGAPPSGKEAFLRGISRRAQPVYLGTVLLGALALLALLLAAAPALPALGRAGLIALLAVPVLTVSGSLASWLVTMLFPPAVLPKLDFDEGSAAGGIPDDFRAVVAIPALISSREEVESLVGQLQMHYLRNPAPGLLFALLADFTDADTAETGADDALIAAAEERIDALNKRYLRPDASGPFLFLYRRRLWNPSERRWMGWERKRGKLHEFNRLILGEEKGLTFGPITGSLAALRRSRYVISLDADTVLPSGAAARLVGTLAHPLNRAVFAPGSQQVIAGYTVLQPRMEISPRSANRSWFTRIFAGDAGLDLYSLAVSDAYQDLFGEGIYVGKGIYDVAAFERAVQGRIPENTLLSHDLLEGILGRAGLVSDITMIEDYPSSFFVQVQRGHRWMRGDWQLLPWLLRPGRFNLRLSAIDRWKIIDNLRRSLLAPVLALLFILGLLTLPAAAPYWSAVIFLALGAPVLLGALRAGLRVAASESPRSAFRPLGLDLLRLLLGITFIPYEAVVAADAALTTLARLAVTRRSLLEWTTAANAARLFRENGRADTAWMRLLPGSLLALALAAWVIFRAPAALPAALAVLLPWGVAPAAARLIARRLAPRSAELAPDQEALLRRITRRTWAFFERYAGPEDHWLPPDHFQEHPVGMVAHRTSPTNIGLLLNATLAAYDLGYLDLLGLAARLAATFDSLERLERFRGHFLNWYDTVTMQPLNPRYISTVDSGNLAASLIVTAQACLAMPREQIFKWELWQGYLDTLALLSETLAQWREFTAQSQTIPRIHDAERLVADMQAEILSVRGETHRWYALFQKVTGPFWQDLSHGLGAVIAFSRSDARRAADRMEYLRTLQMVTAQAERQHQAVQRIIEELAPWVPLFAAPPGLLARPEFQDSMAALRAALPNNPVLEQIRACAESARPQVETLRAALQAAPSGDARAAALAWLEAVEQGAWSAAANATVLMAGYARQAALAETFVTQMEFGFLYHPKRHVFHIGYNLDAGQLDSNFYDLLASEARIASLVAIAVGQVPQQHWLHMNRPVTSVEGARVLLSWSATMFEYLMPPLFLRSYTGTLLDSSARGAVAHQIAYARGRAAPWGISESGFYRLDANQSYQYRAFGAPGLGYKRGLADDLVIAPYASLMAVRFDPQAVFHNMLDLIAHGALGPYGFYEAIDFTRERLMVGEKFALVREYMAHHQGMILLAAVNYLQNNIMVRRMHADPRIASVEILLQEQIPLDAPLQDPSAAAIQGTRREVPARIEIQPWTVPVHTTSPQLHLLSNGAYSLLIANSGSGCSTWKGVGLTRWQPDRVLDAHGAWIYIQEARRTAGADLPSPGEPWSAAYQPIPGDPGENQVTFFPHMVVFRRTKNSVISTLEVTISPDDPVEIRRVTINNTGAHRRQLRLTSYGEVILNQQAADARHPAFNKMFIESEWVSDLNLQIFRRRPRSETEEPIFLGHMLVAGEGLAVTGASEDDRAAFIGRGGSPRRPRALLAPGYLSGSGGATLDPIFSIGQDADLQPHETARVAYLTFAAPSREALLALAARYSSMAAVDQTFHQADLSAQSWLAHQNIDGPALRSTLQALSACIYPTPETRANPEALAANRLGQPGLWRFGISGDYPILLVNLEDPRQLDLAREALQAHRFARTRGFLLDLVLLNHQHTDYGAQLNGMLYRLVSRASSEHWFNQRGGVFVLHADQMHPEERTLLQASARVALAGDRGSLEAQLPPFAVQVPHLPAHAPTLAPAQVPVTGDSAPAAPPHLDFYNGYGGFSPDGREYVILLPPGTNLPAPWVNVIGYPGFGFLVSESGSSCTWAVNSGENRLTPWHNDPVSDPTGEALYLRDEETGEFWTPTPLPAGASAAYTVRHEAGCTTFTHHSHGLMQQMAVYASPQEPVKIIRLRVENTLDRPRRITATQYVEWVLGVSRAASAPYILSEYDAACGCLLASNPYNIEFAGRTAFLAASKPIHGLTTDRAEFLGRSGEPGAPAALRRMGLENRLNPGEDPCAVLQVHLDLLPGGWEEIHFVLGQAEDKESALRLARKYRTQEAVETAWSNTRAFWDRLLETVQVRTPDPAFNHLINRWALYQALSCRVWGRTAFYQSSGAFGFRDQLQDVLAVLAIDPAIARGQILNAARHQFEEGDVLHWWHPPSGRGVRTRFSDDLLWLPYVTARYVEVTGDSAILDEREPFRSGPPLKPGEEERYGHYALSAEPATLYEHCLRAVERGATRGGRGLPLIGSGDWNDGFNRVGIEGRGESVWLGWFLIDVLRRFAPLCEARGDGDRADRWRALAEAYAAAIEKNAWDGAWYRRAYFDDGQPLGAAASPECKIDAIAQSWAVLSGAGEPARARRAMQSVFERLVRPAERLLLLFTPPFDHAPQDPGYIKGYLPGIRENGGQYTHAAAWTAWAAAENGDGQRAWELFDLLNPIFQADSADKAAVYRVEPYVVCADIYSVEPYLRRGGWTWYTGSAAWVYRLGLEALLGFRREGSFLRIRPAAPPRWQSYEITYRFGSAAYHITVTRGEGQPSLTLDGLPIPGERIPLEDDGQEHKVAVCLADAH